MTQNALNRRSFLVAGAAALSTSLIVPAQAQAATAPSGLYLVNYRTGETYNRVFYDGKRLIQSALDEFDWFARDWREGKAVRMSRDTMFIAADLQRRYGDRKMALISGYRTAKTNHKLTGAAKHSYHMKGMAFDLTMPGISSSRLYHTAWSNIHQGGVGKYTKSNFVHVDSGPVRTWGS